MLAMAFKFLPRSPFHIAHPLRVYSRALSAAPIGRRFGITLRAERPLHYDKVHKILSARGNLISLRKTHNHRSKAYVAQFDDTSVEDALLAGRSLTISGTDVQISICKRDKPPQPERTREDVPPSKHVRVNIPMQYGVQKDKVQALISSFGGRLETFRKYTTVQFRTQKDADRFVEAGWTGEGFRVQGHRVWVNYSTNKV